MAGKEESGDDNIKKNNGADGKQKKLKDLPDEDLEYLSHLTAAEMADYIQLQGEDLTPNSLRRVKAKLMLIVGRERRDAAEAAKKQEEKQKKKEAERQSKSRQSNKQAEASDNASHESSDAASQASAVMVKDVSARKRKHSPMKISSRVDEHRKRRIPTEAEFSPFVAERLSRLITHDEATDRYTCRGSGCNRKFRMNRQEAQKHCASHHSAAADDSAEAVKKDRMQLHYIADVFGENAYNKFVCPHCQPHTFFESYRALIDHIKQDHPNSPERFRLNDPEALREIPPSMLHEFRQDVFPGRTHKHLPDAYKENFGEGVFGTKEEDDPDQRFVCNAGMCNGEAEYTSAEFYVHHYNHHTKEREALVAEYASLFPSVKALYAGAKREGETEFDCRFGTCAHQRQPLHYESYFELMQHLAKEHKTLMFNILDSQGKRDVKRSKPSDAPTEADAAEKREQHSKKNKKGPGRNEVFDDKLIAKKDGKFFAKCCPDHIGFCSKTNAERHMKKNCPAGKKMLDARGIERQGGKNAAKKQRDAVEQTRKTEEVKKRHLIDEEKEGGGEKWISPERLWRYCAVKHLSSTVTVKRSHKKKKEKRDQKHRKRERRSSGRSSLSEYRARRLDMENKIEEGISDDDMDWSSDPERLDAMPAPTKAKRPKESDRSDRGKTPKTHKKEDERHSENSATRALDGGRTPKVDGEGENEGDGDEQRQSEGAEDKLNVDPARNDGKPKAIAAGQQTASIEKVFSPLNLHREKNFEDLKSDADEAGRDEAKKSQHESGSGGSHPEGRSDDMPLFAFQEGQRSRDNVTPPVFKRGSIKEEPQDNEEDFGNARRGGLKQSGGQTTKRSSDQKAVVEVDLTLSDEDEEGVVEENEVTARGNGEAAGVAGKKENVGPPRDVLPVADVVGGAANGKDGYKAKPPPPGFSPLRSKQVGGESDKKIRIESKREMELRERKEDDEKGRALKNKTQSSKQQDISDESSESEAEGYDDSDDESDSESEGESEGESDSESEGESGGESEGESDSAASSDKPAKAALKSIRQLLKMQKPLAESAIETAQESILKAIPMTEDAKLKALLGQAVNALNAQK